MHPNPYQPTPVPLSATPDAAPIAPRPGRDTPDPGSPKAARLALIALIILTAGVFVLQQLGASAPATQPTNQVTAPVGFDPFAGMSRLMLRFSGIFDQVSGTPQEKEKAKQDIAAMLDGNTVTDVDKVRAAIVKGFIAGPDAALQSLDNFATAAAAKPTPFEGLDADAQLIRTAFEQGKDALSAADQQRLTDRHGYFAKVLFAATDPAAAAERDRITAGGAALMVLMIVFGLFLLAVFITAVICFGIALSMLTKGRIVPKFRAPEPGGSVFLETVAALAAGFLGLKVLMGVIEAIARGTSGGGMGMLMLSFALQWSLIAVIFYPRFRGVPWSEARRRMGLHSGQGFFKEIAAGIFAYFATLPIVLAVIVVTLIAVLARGMFQSGGAGGGGGPVPPENPIIEIIASGNWLVLGMLYLLATIWAPLVEETVFRGCLYRHLRSRLPIVVCALLSAIVFAVMHGYEFMLLGPVLALGFNFALMREWRDSLVGPIAAHALHNGTVLIIAIVAMNQMAVPPA
jgi:membrane protease YdiL (CAAX protease family)